MIVKLRVDAVDTVTRLEQLSSLEKNCQKHRAACIMSSPPNLGHDSLVQGGPGGSCVISSPGRARSTLVSTGSSPCVILTFCRHGLLKHKLHILRCPARRAVQPKPASYLAFEWKSRESNVPSQSVASRAATSTHNEWKPLGFISSLPRPTCRTTLHVMFKARIVPTRHQTRPKQSCCTTYQEHAGPCL